MNQDILEIKNLNFDYGSQSILRGINLNIPENKVISIMGPSGCGKTTLLRCFNRMYEFSENAKVKGGIFLEDQNIFDMNSILLRRKVGMVFQRPNPFPTMSIYENVLAGYRLNGIRLEKMEQNHIVENALQQAALWNEVKDSLHKKGTFLSGGQQQRLCIARTLAMEPKVLLLDEPTSALDPKATTRIEELITELKNSVTIILVTHNINQAARVSDNTAFLYLGELVEYGLTEKLFTVPKDKRTEEYLAGHFG